MIVLMILLWCLSAVFITRFLERKKMKTAQIAYTVLFIYLLAWIFLIFFLDVKDYGFGFTSSKFAALYGSYSYHEFVNLTQALYQLPAGVLVAIIVACLAIGISAISVVILGGIHIVKAIIELAKHSREIYGRPEVEYSIAKVFMGFSRIYIKNCRLNC